MSGVGEKASRTSRRTHTSMIVKGLLDYKNAKEDQEKNIDSMSINRYIHLASATKFIVLLTDPDQHSLIPDKYT